MLFLRVIARELSKYYSVEVTETAGMPAMVAAMKRDPSIYVRLLCKDSALVFEPPWPRSQQGQLQATHEISLTDPASQAKVVRSVNQALLLQSEFGTRAWIRYCGE